MSGSVIRPCTCASSYQDQKYGTGNRVHNVGKKQDACTSCGKGKDNGGK